MVRELQFMTLPGGIDVEIEPGQVLPVQPLASTGEGLELKKGIHLPSSTL